MNLNGYPKLKIENGFDKRRSVSLLITALVRIGCGDIEEDMGYNVFIVNLF